MINRKHLAGWMLGVVAFIFLLGLAGRQDYTDRMINTISQSDYDTIKSKLGENTPDYKIVVEYETEKNIQSSKR